ncbi:hypothetical protein GGH92_005483, partial [Coemansia sp. RSA 2673]
MKADNGDGKDLVRMLVTAPSVTTEHIRLLRQKEVYLLDYDYAVDVRFVSTRGDILEFLRLDDKWDEKRVTDRENRVGKHCLSWYGYDEDGNKMRYKVYNKLVELIESKGVRVILGSSIYEFMGNDPITTTMSRFKDDGMMRIEVTFYGDKLKSEEFCREQVMKLYNRFISFKTYRVSFKQHWENMVTEIKQVLAVYEIES